MYSPTQIFEKCSYSPIGFDPTFLYDKVDKVFAPSSIQVMNTMVILVNVLETIIIMSSNYMTLI